MANWIASAIKHPGAMTRKAKKEGVSNKTFEQEHKGESGTAGREARLAITLGGFHGVKHK